jgi:hypothetical protein
MKEWTAGEGKKFKEKRNCPKECQQVRGWRQTVNISLDAGAG